MFDSLFGSEFNNKIVDNKPLSKPAKVKTNKIELKEDIALENGQLFENEGFITKTKELLDKLNHKNEADIDPDKVLKSKKLSLAERLSIINTNVLKILGKQKGNILVIKDRETFHNYITKAIEAGRIAIDTETNNSTDTVLCKLAGLCLYTPGEKQAYIPINHRNFETKERLSWQLTEEDCREELQRIVDAKTFKIFHNGKFDYKVIKCTCGIEIIPDWDTQIAAWLKDENEFGLANSSLKHIYTTYIDRTQEKYAIDDLFANVSYLDVDPNIFAYYASSDAMMTDKVYLWELPFYQDEDNKRVKWVYENVELPLIQVTAEIELKGVKIDIELGNKLRDKYTKKLETLDASINEILESLSPLIKEWSALPSSNEQAKVYVSKKSKMSAEKLVEQFPNVDSSGRRYKLGKSKVAQLESPINLGSPIQLAILFYDILNVSKAWAKEGIKDGKDCRDEITKLADDFDRKAGKDELKKITDLLAKYLVDDKEEDEEEDLSEEVATAAEITQDDLDHFKYKAAANLANLMLKRRNITKLITTYFDVIPTLAEHWPDGRIRYNLNQTGTNTGRFSSGGKWHWLDSEDHDVKVSGINSQNIPSRGDGKITRLLFIGDTIEHRVEIEDDYYAVPETDEVKTIDGWKAIQELSLNDIIVGEDNQEKVERIEKVQNFYRIYTSSVA